jgi:hypothetical protein
MVQAMQCGRCHIPILLLSILSAISLIHSCPPPSGSGFLVQFVLSKGVMVANTPEPLDARVKLREMSSKRAADLT